MKSMSSPHGSGVYVKKTGYDGESGMHDQKTEERQGAMRTMHKVIASLVCVSAVCVARADYTLERSAAQDGLLLTDGVKQGSYYVRLEGFSGDDASTRAKVWHEGRRVEFVRGGPWMNDNGTQRMTLESRLVEVKPGEAFRIDRETPGRRAHDLPSFFRSRLQPARPLGRGKAY